MNQQPVRIDGQAVTTEQSAVLRAPYDGAELARLPTCSAVHVDWAVTAAARASVTAPLPTWRRAEVLDRAAELLADHDIVEDLARTIAFEAAKPITTARAEVARCRSTFRSRCRGLSTPGGRGASVGR